MKNDIRPTLSLFFRTEMFKRQLEIKRKQRETEYISQEFPDAVGRGRDTTKVTDNIPY